MEQGSMATSLKLTMAASYVYFCGGFFFFNCSNSRGKATSSASSSYRGCIGLWHKHAEGTIQVLSFVNEIWECGWLG